MWGVKTCTKCGEEKSLDDFHRRKASKDGREASCKTCRQGYYQENKDAFRERTYKWRAENPEGDREIRKRAYWNGGKEKQREWNEANRDKRREYARHWYHANPDKAKAIWLRFKENNPDYWRDYFTGPGLKYRIADRERYRSDPEFRQSELQRGRDYKQRHPEKGRESTRRYRARKFEAFVEHMAEDEIIQRDLGLCGICGDQVMTELEIDHIVPLSRKGLHSPDNLRLTHKSCNRQKHDKLPGEHGDIRPIPTA